MNAAPPLLPGQLNAECRPATGHLRPGGTDAAGAGVLAPGINALYGAPLFDKARPAMLTFGMGGYPSLSFSTTRLAVSWTRCGTQCSSQPLNATLLLGIYDRNADAAGAGVFGMGMTAYANPKQPQKQRITWKMRTAISNWWGTIPKPAAGALAVWAVVIIVAFGLTVYLSAWILYDENELAWAIIIVAALSLVATVAQIVAWTFAQPPPRHWLTTIQKVWKELIVGVAMHYPAILSGVSLGALVLSGNDKTNALSPTNVTIVLVQQTVLTGVTWLMFRERLRKRTHPGQPNQPAGQPNQPAGQPNQPAGARKEDKQMPVVLALLALLAIVQVLLALLSVVTVLAFFANTKKGKRRRRR